MIFFAFHVLLVVNSVLAKNVIKYDLDDAYEHFETFRRTYNKVYDEKEAALRYEIFVKNLEKIIQNNERSRSAVFGITQFTDLTPEEFVQRYGGYESSNRTEDFLTRRNLDDDYVPGYAPESFDWRGQGVVSVVKNQCSCKCCWAFSVTGNLESAYAIKYRQSILLSEQQLVDCDKNSNGCKGGNIGYACEYLRQNGAMTADNYPFEERDNVCRYNSYNAQVKVASCMSIHVSEEELVGRLASIGPLSIGIDSSALQTYNGGTIHDGYCQGTQINHAVLLVGYGTDENGMKYWLVKNSWGTAFGEQGYFKMMRGVNCLRMVDAPAVAVVV